MEVSSMGPASRAFSAFVQLLRHHRVPKDLRRYCYQHLTAQLRGIASDFEGSVNFLDVQGQPMSVICVLHPVSERLKFVGIRRGFIAPFVEVELHVADKCFAWRYLGCPKEPQLSRERQVADQ